MVGSGGVPELREVGEQERNVLSALLDKAETVRNGHASEA